MDTPPSPLATRICRRRIRWLEALRVWQKTGKLKFALSVALFAILTMAFFVSNRSFSFAYWL